MNHENKNESIEPNDKQENESLQDSLIDSLQELNQLGNDLLKRTHDYCIVFSVDESDKIRKVIDKITRKLTTSIDTKEIAMLSTTLKTLHDIYSSLHTRSVIAFMSAYTPLSKLLQVETNTTQGINILDMENDVGTSTEQNDTIETPDDVDISNLYKPYED